MKFYISPELKNVSETLLVPLFYRAKETLEHGIIEDDASREIVRNITYDVTKLAVAR